MGRARRNEEDAPYPGPGYTFIVGPLADMAPQNFGYLSEEYDAYKDMGAYADGKHVVIGYKYPSRGPAPRFPRKPASYTVLLWDDESASSRPAETHHDGSIAHGRAQYIRSSLDPQHRRTQIISRRAKKNMAGRPGRLGLPRYEGPRPEGYAKFGKKDLRDMASSGDQLAAMELEWRKQDRAMRSGLLVPERVVKRPAHPPQVTAFAPGFGAVPAVEKGQQVFRITLHGQPLPTEKMPAGRYALTMERAAAMSHKLDPQTGERLRFGKTKSQRLGSKAAANPRTWRGAQSKKTRAGKLTKRQRKIKRDWKAAGRTAPSLFPQSAGYSTWPKGSVVTEPRYPAASYVGYVPKKAPWKKTLTDIYDSPEQARKIRQRRKASYKREAAAGKGSHRGMLRAYSDLRHALGAEIEPEWLEEQFPPVSEATHWTKHDLREAAQELWDLAEEKGAVIPESVDAIANPYFGDPWWQE
jgi:hypothetical protein